MHRTNYTADLPLIRFWGLVLVDCIHDIANNTSVTKVEH